MGKTVFDKLRQGVDEGECMTIMWNLIDEAEKQSESIKNAIAATDEIDCSADLSDYVSDVLVLMIKENT